MNENRELEVSEDSGSKPKVFFYFTWLELSIWKNSGHVGLCWRILATRCAMFVHFGAMLRHVGEKIRPKSAKMPRRVDTWRPKSNRFDKKSVQQGHI